LPIASVTLMWLGSMKAWRGLLQDRGERVAEDAASLAFAALVVTVCSHVDDRRERRTGSAADVPDRLDVAVAHEERREDHRHAGGERGQHGDERDELQP
jgi:hypothetical protein